MSLSFPITLTDLEFEVATVIGERRNRHADRSGYNQRYTLDGKTHGAVENHILGAAAELGIARLLRLPWRHHVGTIEGTDVGEDVEVRCRRLRSPDAVASDDPIRAGLLTLGKRDKPKLDKAFVLVHRYEDDPGHQLQVMGWRMGRDVMRRQYWMADPDIPDGVCRLPHADLQPIDDLIRYLDERAERRHDEQLRWFLHEHHTS